MLKCDIFLKLLLICNCTYQVQLGHTGGGGQAGHVRVTGVAGLWSTPIVRSWLADWAGLQPLNTPSSPFWL